MQPCLRYLKKGGSWSNLTPCTYVYKSSKTTKLLGLPPMVWSPGPKGQSHSGKNLQNLKFSKFAPFQAARAPPLSQVDPPMVNTGTVATYFRSFLFLSQHRVPLKNMYLKAAWIFQVWFWSGLHSRPQKAIFWLTNLLQTIHHLKVEGHSFPKRCSTPKLTNV